MDAKKFLLFVVPAFVLLLSDCQSKKRFDYELLSTGNFLVSPVFKQKDPIGDLGLAYIIDHQYAISLFTQPVEASISKEKRDSLHPGNKAKITYNILGEILSCEFLINNNDRDILNEEDLYQIYGKLKQTKVDLSKIWINPDHNIKAKTGDYAYLSGDMVVWTSSDYDLICRNDLYLIGPDSSKSSIPLTFHINSLKYHMVTKSGKTIKVGMSASELKSIFPKSYYRSKILRSFSNVEGKFRFPVYLSFYSGQKLLKEDSSIIFVLSDDGSVLEEFFLFEPS